MPTARPATARRPLLDARLLVGIALVVISVVGVVALVGAADQRVTVYATSASLVPGDRIRDGDLLTREVALDGAAGLYLQPRDLAGDLVATQVVRAGELVPLTAVGSRAGSESTALVLPLSGPVSASVVAGAVVDVWSSSAGDASSDWVPGVEGFGAPVVLSADATVVRVVEPDGIVSAADGEAVEVLIPRSRIARVLQAIANGDALAVVPAGIPLPER